MRYLFMRVENTLTVNAISGYSGGGNALIDIFESDEHEPWGAYGYSMNHKHLPEMAKYTLRLVYHFSK